MNDIKVSVITVCLNSVKTIEQTIQSVIAQSYNNIEYIIIDGGSTDGTLDIIQKYDSRIACWISEPDRGIYDAMNKGIKRATGDVVGIINSDDWYEKNAILNVVSYFHDHPEIDVIHGDLVVINELGEKHLVKGIDPQNETAGDWYSHPTVFIKRKIYEQLGLYDLRYPILADGAYMLALKHNKVPICRIPHILAYFRLGGACNTSKLRWKRIMEMKSIMGQAIKQYATSQQVRIEMESTKNKYIQGELTNYAFSRMNRYHLLRRFLIRMLEISKKEAFVFWGTGSDGFFLGKQLIYHLDLLHSFIDGDSNKVGKCFLGKGVIGPEALNSKWYIIISTRNYFKEIQDYLFKNGYKWGDDFISYDDFIYNLIIGAFPKLLNKGKVQHDCIFQYD